MIQEIPPEVLDQKLIISGIHLHLTDAIKMHVRDKATKLIRHEPRIDRIRIDLEYHETKSHHGQFTVKGLVEISGPDIIASANGDDAYASIDKLISELDRGLRKRATDRLKNRNHPHGIDLEADLPKID
jgi:putative sigma-54 modulation protein